MEDELGRPKPLQHTARLRTPRYRGEPSVLSSTVAGITVVVLLLAEIVAVALLALAPIASAAPSGPVSAQETVARLQANGYRVIVSRIGALPLDQCHVTATRPGRPVMRTKSLSDDHEQEIVYTTVYVDAKC